MKGKNKTDLIIVLILVLTICFLFSASLKVFFIADDTDWIIIAKSYNNLTSFMRGSGLAVFRPVISSLFLLQYKLFGLNYQLYHLTNIFFHILNTILIYILLSYLFKEKIFNFLAALFFAITYSHHQAIIWIGAMVDIVCTFFYLLSIILFINYHKKNSKTFLILSLTTYLFALGSKEMVITLPLIIFLINYFLLKDNLIICLKNSSGYISLTLMYLLFLQFTSPDLSSQLLSKGGDYAIGGHFLPITLSCLFQLLYPLLGTNLIHSNNYLFNFLNITTVVLILIIFLAILHLSFKLSASKNLWKTLFLSLILTGITILPVSFFHSMANFGSFTRFRYLYLPSTIFSFTIVSLFLIMYEVRRDLSLITKMVILTFMGYIFIINIPANLKIIEEYKYLGNMQHKIVNKVVSIASYLKDKERNLYLIGFPPSFKYIYEPHQKNALKLFSKKDWNIYWIEKEEISYYLNNKGIFLLWTDGKINRLKDRDRL